MSITNAATDSHSIAVKNDGTLWATGPNEQGQLGVADPANYRTWIQTLTEVATWIPAEGRQSIATGGRHSLAIKANGTVWATGWGENGQLGLGDEIDRRGWGQTFADAKAVAAGYVHSLILKTDGTLWGAGSNQFGQLGMTGSACTVLGWTQTLTDVFAIACGHIHSLALKTDGSLWVTGFNANGELGLGDTDHRHSWTKVMECGKPHKCSIAGGYRHSLVSKEDGSLWATGVNQSGQLGLGDCTNRIQWTLSLLKNVWSVSAGYYHSLAVTRDDEPRDREVYAAGGNPSGETGLGHSVQRTETWQRSRRCYAAVTNRGMTSLAICFDGLRVTGHPRASGIPDPDPAHGDPLYAIWSWTKTLE